MNNTDADPRPSDAVKALRARGVNSAEDMLEHGTPDQLLAVCRRWDAQRGSKSTGLLVHWIRQGEFNEPAASTAPSKGSMMRSRFEEYAAQFPVGTVAEPHARLQARRWPEDEPCPGSMRVIEATYPLLSMECDECGFAAALGPRHLHVLGSATGRPF